MKRFFFLLATSFLISSCSYAQLGFPPFGSFESGSFDAVNRQNLNTNAAFPIISGKGRGVDFRFSVYYNSLIWRNSGRAWTPVTDQSGVPTWGWNRTSVLGTITYTITTKKCFDTDTATSVPYQLYNRFSYTEPDGARHSFGIIVIMAPSGCGFTSPTPTAHATDASGYFMDATDPTAAIVYDRAGKRIFNGTKLEDTNGNYISSTTVSSSETDWQDTVGNSQMKVVSSPSSVQYQYMDTTGTYRTITMNLYTYNVKTNFGCSGVTEYTGTATLPSSIVYPNGTSYSFSYEQTPNNPGYITGRLSQIVVPTLGVIIYQFGTTNDGINCTDGTVMNLTRTIRNLATDAVWQFVRSPNGSNWLTTVTAPQMPYDLAPNQTVFTFNSNGQELSRQIYQGSVSGTQLRTINTTWAGSTPATKTTILEDNSQSQIETSYDSNGNLLSLKEHDYGSGGLGPILRTTNYAYLSTSAYTNLNIVDRVSVKTIADSLGTVRYREDTAYDSTTLGPCPTGVIQHDDVFYGCTNTTRGNPTAVTIYADASTPSGGVTKNRYYDVFGNVVKADVDCSQQQTWTYSATTRYSSPDSVTSGATGGPQTTVSLATNMSTLLLASTTDANNQSTSNAYDTIRRITTVTRPDQAQIIYTYDDIQHTVTVANPVQGTNVAKETTYLDRLNRTYLKTVTDSVGTVYSITKTEFDPFDRPYRQSNPYTTTPQYWIAADFDALGRPVKQILQDGSQTIYTYSGKFTTITDPTGKQRKHQYDGLAHLVNVFEPDPSSGNSLTLQTSYTYTVLDQKATLAQGVQTRTYNHDGMGRLTSETTPEAGTVSYQYNAYNKITQRTDARGVVTTYAYDTMNRLTQISYNVGSTGVPTTPSVGYTYGTSPTQNNNGRLVTVADGVGSTNYSYDVLGRTIQVQPVIGGNPYTVGYQYNLNGQVTSLTYPSGKVFNYTYDSIGRLTSIANGTTNLATGITYNPEFQQTGFTYGNGIVATFGHSADRLQLQSFSHTNGGTVLFGQSFGYAQNGGNNDEVTSITDSADPGRNMTYTYDALRRLTSAVSQGSIAYPQWGLSFIYDRYGNLTAQTVTAGSGYSSSVTIDPNTNRIVGDSYDANGNTTNDGQNTLVFDAENRLVSATSTSGAATYSYWSSGNRSLKVSGGTTTVSIYNGNQLIAEYNNGSLANEYIHLGRHLLAGYIAGALRYYHSDRLSVRLITDANANSVSSLGNYPFGNTWYSTGTGTKWMFTNYLRDSESGNDYAYGRYYGNRRGRFMTPDLSKYGGPDSQLLNRYSYVGNEPITRIDPAGREIGYCIDGFCGTCDPYFDLSCGPPQKEGGGGPISIGIDLGGGGGGAQGTPCELTMMVHSIPPPGHFCDGQLSQAIARLVGPYELVDPQSVRWTVKSKGSVILQGDGGFLQNNFSWYQDYRAYSSKKNSTITFTAKYSCIASGGKKVTTGTLTIDCSQR